MSEAPEFGKQAAHYARHRPSYPDELFAYLAALAPGRALAWDAGTGNGQAAVGLAPHFDRVVATDLSEGQLANAMQHPKVEYRQSRAEQTDFEDASVDLITAAQAMHWFDLDGFYQEVRRVLRPGGVLAAWTYPLPQITPVVDALIHHLFHDVLGSYWAYGRHWVDEDYRTIPFPFAELEQPEFTVQLTWQLDDLIGLLHSWSARQKFLKERGFDPLDDLRPKLAAAWGDPQQQRPVRWPLYFRIGKLPAEGDA